MELNRIRTLIYAHDVYGLGHLRRCLRIAERLCSSPYCHSVLLATGSPAVRQFELPPNCRYLQLPQMVMTRQGTTVHWELSGGTTLEEAGSVRGRLLKSAVDEFRPHLILIDDMPVGEAGELKQLFEYLEGRSDRPRLVLGLRDIVEEAGYVKHCWTSHGAWDAVRNAYDRILVYGDPSVLTTAQELELTEIPGDKVRFVGYLAPPAIPASPNNGRPLIVVTTGGGEDGYPILDSYCEFLQQTPKSHFKSVVVTGPFLSSERSNRIRRRLDNVPGQVEVLSFTDRMSELLSGASGVICMGGYNTMVEVMAAGVPAMAVPRGHATLEQAIRVKRLAHFFPFEVAQIDALHPFRISEFVGKITGGNGRASRTGMPRNGLRMDGLETVTAEIRALLEQRPRNVKRQASVRRPRTGSVRARPARNG